jgi:hypothetical protein
MILSINPEGELINEDMADDNVLKQWVVKVTGFEKFEGNVNPLHDQICILIFYAFKCGYKTGINDIKHE